MRAALVLSLCSIFLAACEQQQMDSPEKFVYP